MSLVITIARTPEERDAVFRLRYTVVVEEARQAALLADHHFRFLEEPQDAYARFVIAGYGDTVVGAWRVNFAGEKKPGPEVDFFEIHRFSDARPHTTAFTSPPLVASGFRNSTVPGRLALAAYAMNLVEGISHDFIACPPDQESFFKDLGYRPYRGRKHLTDHGDVLPMVLVLRDVRYLSDIHSPLLEHWRDDHPVAATRSAPNHPPGRS